MAAYRVEPFQAWHIQDIRIQDDQGVERTLFRQSPLDLWKQVEGHGCSSAAFRDERIIECGGILPLWSGRAQAWAVLAENLTAGDLLFIHRITLEAIESSSFRRIEMSVRESFDQGHRWARMLGFSPEGLMRHYDPQGHDHRLYARIAL